MRTGGVAALNHRLMALNPPGSLRLFIAAPGGFVVGLGLVGDTGRFLRAGVAEKRLMGIMGLMGIMNLVEPGLHFWLVTSFPFLP